MSDSEGRDGADEDLGQQIRDVLIAADMISAGEVEAAAEPSELGRLVRAFVRVDDPRIRSEIISLLEAIGLFQSEGHPLPRR
jgi:hypothetical protein